MTDIKTYSNKKGVSPVAAAITGVVVGAGVAVAGVAMQDEKNRASVKKALNNLKDQAAHYVEDMQQKMQGKPEKGVLQGKKKVKKLIADSKKGIQKTK